MHRKTRYNLIVVSRLLMAAIVMSALIVGAVVSFIVAAPAAAIAKADTVKVSNVATTSAEHPAVIVTDWRSAFRYMSHGDYWCAIDKAPELKCMYYPWNRLPLMERPVNFRGAMRELRHGRAITRIEPHLWIWVWGPWF